MLGYILYLLLVAILVLFWRVRAGRNLDQMLDDIAHHHHDVIAFLKTHPLGADWAGYCRGMSKVDAGK